MEEILKRLLDAEAKAEEIVNIANAKRERMISQALEDGRAAEARFEARIPEIQASFADKAEERASQAVAELKRRYEERHKYLRELAEAHEREALDAAIALILDPAKN